MTGQRAAALGVVILAVLVAAWWFLRSSASSPLLLDAPGLPPAATERTISAGCDPLPTTPALPGALAPAAPTVEAVVQALDATLTDAHKAFLRCFPDEEDVVARVHQGLGRWLRRTLHLTTDSPLVASLRSAGARNPDEMSTVILRAYTRALRGAPLDVPDAVARTRAMSDTFKP